MDMTDTGKSDMVQEGIRLEKLQLNELSQQKSQILHEIEKLSQISKNLQS